MDMIFLKRCDDKSGYTGQDTPSTRLKITWDIRTDGRTDGRTDITFYRHATAHLKNKSRGAVSDAI